MRAKALTKTVLMALATVAMSAPLAFADPVAIPTPVLSTDLQESLSETYGESEGAYLQLETLRLVQAALAREGGEAVAAGAPLTIEITILEAVPNRPTMRQMRDTPGLSMQSLGVGGAEFEAVIRDASGAERARVTHEHFSFDIEDAIGASTWSDARIAMRGFARKVAEAYATVS